MARLLQIGGLLIAAAGAAVCDNQAKPAKAPPPPKPAPTRSAPRGGGNPKMGPALVNPSAPAVRLYQASPQDRDRVIERMPPAQQARMRKQLEYYDSLPPGQQAIMLQRVQKFDALTPEKRREFRAQMQAMNALPVPRRQAVARALRRLAVMPEAQRVIILNSDTFKNEFSAEEQKMISGLSEVMVPDGQ